jgi:hypothetical protein
MLKLLLRYQDTIPLLCLRLLTFSIACGHKTFCIAVINNPFDVAVTVSGKGSILPQPNRCDPSKKSQLRSYFQSENSGQIIISATTDGTHSHFFGVPLQILPQCNNSIHAQG